MRILALDVGEARIGVAMSDPTRTLATPITAVPRRNGVPEVLRLAAEYDAAEIIVGLPVSLSGEKGPQARRVSRFAEDLTRETAIPVTTVDERYSTVEAERLLRAAGVESSKDRGRLDAAAAAVILQSYLDSQPQQDLNPPPASLP